MKCTWLFFILGLSLCVKAQSYESVAVNLIGRYEGLLETDNRFCYKDSDGFFWFSSIAGLHRFDGHQIVRYTSSVADSTSLKGQNVNGLFFEDDQRNIWFSTSEAINCYVRKNNTFRSFTCPDIENGTYYTCGLDASDRLWFYCDSLLMTFDISSHLFEVMSPITDGTQRAIVWQDKTGNVSQVFAYSLDRSYPGFQVLDFTNQEKPKSFFHFDGTNEPRFPIRDIFIQNDTMLWVACRAGLFSFDRNSGDYTLYNPLPDIPDIYINAVEAINDTLLLLISYSNGAFTFNTRSKEFERHFYFTHNDIVIPDHPQAVYADADGGIWVSMPGSGIAFYHPGNHVFRSFRHIYQTPVTTSFVKPNSFIELSAHQVWGSSNSLGAFIIHENQQFEKLFYKEITKGWPANHTLMSKRDRKGRIWILTAGQPCVRFPDDHIITIPTPEPVSFYAICEAPQGYMVLAPSDGGLFRSIDNTDRTISLERIVKVDVPEGFSHVYAHTDGLIYGAVYQSHFEVYDPGLDFKKVATIPFKADVQCMEPANGGRDILIGTDRGLYCYNSLANTLDSLHWAKDISNLIVFGIVPIDQREIWISTNNGIYSLDPENKVYVRYGLEHGTGTLIFNRQAHLLRSNGEIWFGSDDGITVFNPSKVSSRLPPQNVVITKLLINDVESPGLQCSETGALNVSEFSSLILPFEQNTFSIEFSSISFSGINQSTYEYRLLGSDEKWVQAGNRGFARYANLPAGEYVFEVRNRDTFSGAKGGIRSLKIYIIPPIYQRWWFLSLVIILAGALLFWIYRNNERRKLRLQQLQFEKRIALETERLRIANDMHDDLGSGLSALSLRAKMLSTQADQPQLQSQLNEFVNSAQHLAQQIRETIWTINSKNDTVDSLVTRLHQYALDFFGGTEIDCTIDLMQEQITSFIPGNHRRELYLTYKEALHNVYKHSHATRISISLMMNDSNQLVMEIKDNGIGFDPKIKAIGNGLDSMSGRMQSIGGQFHIDSGKEGTHITLIYPV